MFGILWLFLLCIAVLLLALPIIALFRTGAALRRQDELEERLDHLELIAASPREGQATATTQRLEPLPTVTAQEPPRPIATPPAPDPARKSEAKPSFIAAPPPPVASSPVLPEERKDIEQMVGGVWLQNAGSVLVLVGVFFLILWGWSTGRFGPGVLVTSGVILGMGIAWRGDRTARTLPNIGHALIGTGLGIVYLSLYLGHFRLHVLSAPVAFAALIAASGLTVAAGLRYRVQGIAALGVIGAFLPQVLAQLAELRDFGLRPGPLLAYLGVVDAVVFALSARVRWSGLALVTVMLSTLTWIIRVPAGEWSWTLQIGLAAVFVALGLAPLLHLTRIEDEARAVDLGLIAASPMALIACSWPIWAAARSVHVAMLLLTLAAIYLAACLWVDSVRPQRDLWRPLSGAAVVFLTAALQRAVGTDNTPLSWTAEGAVLVMLGLVPRAEWLRLWGYLVLTLGGFVLLLDVLDRGSVHPLPLWNTDGFRDAVSIAAILITGFRLRAARDRLSAEERVIPHLGAGFAQFLIMLWIRREASHLSWSLEGSGGRWRGLPSPEAAPGELREPQLLSATTALGWLGQGAILIWSSLRAHDRWPFLRHCGYVVVAGALIALILTLALPDGWGRNLLPVLHRDGMFLLAGALALSVIAVRLASARGELLNSERKASEVFALGAALVLLLWITREADHVARMALGVPGPHSSAWHQQALAGEPALRSLAPTLTSVGWLVQALLTLGIGWWRGSAFLRWMGLGLVGLTAAKILLMDLANADPFWRFLAAIATGIAMLGVSYAYQLRKRREAARAQSA